ncbi:MAG: hypothetical protein WC788_01980 [Candidatus Paceibacterota bacterium]
MSEQNDENIKVVITDIDGSMMPQGGPMASLPNKETDSALSKEYCTMPKTDISMSELPKKYNKRSTN